jgi:hypothetical protein
MSTRRGVAILLVVAAAGVLVVSKGIGVWPFRSDRAELVRLLGETAKPWLDEAEITEWSPDANRRPQSYLVTRSMSESDFIAGLTVNPTPLPSGVFVLPPGLKLNRWLDPSVDSASQRDASATTDRALTWSRWRNGVAYTVVHPNY